MHIKNFNTRVRYMASKAKPKKVSLRTLETGEQVYFLCKQASLAGRKAWHSYCTCCFEVLLLLLLLGSCCKFENALIYRFDLCAPCPSDMRAEAYIED